MNERDAEIRGVRWTSESIAVLASIPRDTLTALRFIRPLDFIFVRLARRRSSDDCQFSAVGGNDCRDSVFVWAALSG